MTEKDPYAEFVPPSQTASDAYEEFSPPTTPAPKPVEKPPPRSYYEQAQNVARLASNALTFGQWDRARAGLAAATSDKTYAEALKEEVGKSKQAGEELGPFMRGTAEVLGGLPTGIGVAGASARAFGTASRPLLQRMGIGAAEGGVLGGLQGAGHTYTGKPEDYIINAGMGSALGLGIGTGAPVAGRAVSGGYEALANRGYFGGPPRPLIRAAEADAPGLANIAGTPGAMLPDAGPSMLGVAQGAVTGTGGPGKTALTTELTTRNVGSPGRITGELNQIFGPAPVPSYVESGVRDRMRQLGQAYDQVLSNARAVDTRPLAQDLEALAINSRGEAQAAMTRVRNMLDVTGNPGVLDPNPQVLQQTRTAVRGMIDSTEDSNTRRLLTQAYGRLTNELHAKVPGIRDIDSAYLELGTQERAIQSTGPGARIFETGRTGVTRPEELRDIMTEAARPKGTMTGPSAEPLRLQQAARAELERLVGTNKNDLATLNRVLAQPQDWNSQKLAIVFGQDKADAIRNVLERESRFANTYQKVVEGSKTAQTLAAQQALDATARRIPSGDTVFGFVKSLGTGTYNRLRAGAAESERDRIAHILAMRDPAQIQGIIDQLATAQSARNRRSNALDLWTQGAFLGGGTALTGR